MNMLRQRLANRAFTLIELMVSVALAGLVVAVAYSGFRASLQAMRISSQMSLRNSILASSIIFACDASDHRLSTDPPLQVTDPDGPVRYNLRILRDGSAQYNVELLPLPASWPQPEITVLTTLKSAGTYPVSGIDPGQVEDAGSESNSKSGQSSMVPAGLFFPVAPFARDMPNAPVFLLKSTVSSSPSFKVSWFGGSNDATTQAAAQNASQRWSGLGFGRKQTRRRTNACIVQTIDSETGAIQSLSFQVTAAAEWTN
jgi:prepilin-type N-terminal cleavage/methylation domain-containing protein